MNRHFEDSLYYMKRAGETAKKGLTEEIEPIEAKLREATGMEKEPEPSKLTEIKDDLRELQDRAEGDAKEAFQNAREAIDEYRATRIESE